ncbi:rubredoxin [Eubacteriaceae bacterium ES2]|nr:rubredoxin [Eubacteriaceae bacterium ES2]
MKKLWRCNVCGYKMEGADAPEVCPKCGAPHDQFTALTDDEAKKVYDSYVTNDIHMEIITLVEKILHLARVGEEINLDPACLHIFQKAQEDSYVLKEMCKAEIAGHISKGKW